MAAVTAGSDREGLRYLRLADTAIMRLGVSGAVRLMERAHDGSVDSWQERVLSLPVGGNRMLLLCSRQSGKSECASILALTRAFRYPKITNIVLAPSQRQAAEIIRRCRSLLQFLPEAGKPDRESQLSLTLSNRSRIIAVPGNEGTSRGYSIGPGALLVADEACQIPDDVWTAARASVATGGDVICMSSAKRKPNCGWFHAAWTGEDDWAKISVSGDEIPRISATYLARERATMSESDFNAEYRCVFPEVVSGGLFDQDWLASAFGDDGGEEDDQPLTGTVLPCSAEEIENEARMIMAPASSPSPASRGGEVFSPDMAGRP